MAKSREHELREIGLVTGRSSTREEAQAIIQGLLSTIRSLRDNPQDTPEKEQTIFSLQAAIAGIRETMPREEDR